MSAFVSMRLASAIYLLSDMAAYDDDGVLRQVASKANHSTRLPIAITTRGEASAGDLVRRLVIEIAEGIGSIDATLAFIANAVPTAFRSLSANPLEVLIAANSETKGLCQHMFVTHDFVPGFQSFELIEMGDVAVTGCLPPRVQFEAATTGRRPGELESEAIERIGLDLFEAMRRIPGRGWNADGSRSELLYRIGGGCELTTIHPAGACSKVLRMWPDRIGERIQP